ncbi:MAG: DUF484 family protein [Proteobacteria bacterium]|jgi:uncharacterized protein|nr:DUF484 family protein [Pseudomonadota bacterium]
MSKQNLKETSPSIDIEDVLAYLKSNPDSAVQYPHLLEHLQLSDNQNPGVTSLIERQIVMLREKLDRMRVQTDELIASARENESIQDRVFNLALEVMSETSMDDLLSTLYSCLQDRFAVDFISLRVPLDLVKNEGLDEFNKRYLKDENFQLALGRIGKKSARCNQRFPDPLLAFFFEDAAENIGSAALLPLSLSFGDTDSVGLLALGANSADRFDANLGTHHLEQIGKIAIAGMSRILASHY